MNQRKFTGVYYRSIAFMENIKHYDTAMGLFYLSNQKKIIAQFAVQVCGSKKSFAVAEVQKITANVPQTCGFADADHPLLFCGCGIECKFAVLSTSIKSHRSSFSANNLFFFFGTCDDALAAMQALNLG